MTKETITPDGWLRTGDIAQLVPSRLSFRIIDRKKNIFKLQQGEYVAPDKVENVYMETGLLVELFLHGDSAQSFAVAVAVPHRERLARLAEERGIAGSFEELCGKV
jgi:long-chain acyl-CoA synthetase